ncbi:BTAD domain-containing putative transcriptional regulator [Kitasatospora sp. NPDC057198]|uniref:AfsR/SARP family transcriptional regulator n=1 Tax=Kitasatospora sp. NPDC057198 TaxID=3346046 RepID=UPI00362C9F31
MAIEGAPLRVQLLGPVRAWRGGAEVPLGPPKQRAVFSVLASCANEVVGVDTIVDALWGGDVPQTAVNGVHTYVAGLRRALDPGRGRRRADGILASVSGGYCLRADPDQVDAKLFSRRYAEARQAVDTGTSLWLYQEALSLWHGEAYSIIPGPFADLERARLREMRLAAVEEWAADMLDAGRHPEIVTELSSAVDQEPLRERLSWLLILTLYRNGRRAHALQVYEETRRLLQRELAIEPGIELRTLHHRMLREHPGLLTHGGEPSDPLLPAVPTPHQLPPLTRVFEGRGRELDRLQDVLEDEMSRQDGATPVVVVDGPAGVGKSALVLRLAHRMLDRFPDGQLYVDLGGTVPGGRPMSAADALRRLLGSLGIEDARIPDDPAACASLYRTVLHDRRMLVVLDDVHSAEQLRPLVPQGPGCVLATSRRSLAGLAARDGAHTMVVGPLADPESARLLVALSGGRLDGEHGATARLVALCGGLPLALRIVAGRLAADAGVPLDTVVEQYTAEHGLLDLLTVDNDPRASVRDAFDASYRALPPEAARMFRYLGLHGGPFTEQIAGTLAQTDRRTTHGLLRLLADRHLLVPQPGRRYGFHRLVRAYAAEHAEQERPVCRQAALSRLRELGPAVPHAHLPARSPLDRGQSVRAS